MARYKGRGGPAHCLVHGFVTGVATPSLADLDRLMNFRVTYRGSRKGLLSIFSAIFFPSGTGLRAHGDSTAVLVSYGLFFFWSSIFFFSEEEEESQCRDVNIHF